MSNIFSVLGMTVQTTLKSYSDPKKDNGTAIEALISKSPSL